MRFLPFAAIALTGCSILNMASYDPNEYQLVNIIRTDAQTMKCTPDNLAKLNYDIKELKNYSQYQPNNEATVKLVNNLYTIVDELSQKDKPSEVYCSAKLSMIEMSAERIERAVGGKPR